MTSWLTCSNTSLLLLDTLLGTLWTTCTWTIVVVVVYNHNLLKKGDESVLVVGRVEDLLVELVAYMNFHNLVDKVVHIEYFVDNLFHMMVDMQQNKFVVVEHIVEYKQVDKLMHMIVVGVVVEQRLMVEIVEDMNFHNCFDMMIHKLVDCCKLFDMMVDKLFDKLNVVEYKMAYKLVDKLLDN